ncbi:MAG: DUF4390 domain-containing protein [Gammaproteobacteria bacterium]|nr:MAG: DUF4390 domain-containing protein [Gammaproteobacteria bacterium]
MRWFLLFLGSLALLPAWGQTIEVERVKVHLDEEVYWLDADVHYDLSDEALEALHHGIPLTLTLEIEIFRPRPFLWDEKVAAVELSFRLSYHPLGKQYEVENLHTGVKRSFPSLEEALRALGRVRHFPMLDKRLLEVGRRYKARLRARLDLDALPIPLRLMAYLSPAWHLKSDWYTWTLPS